MGIIITPIYNYCDCGAYSTPSQNARPSDAVIQIAKNTKLGDELGLFVFDVVGYLPSNAYVFGSTLIQRWTNWGDSAAAAKWIYGFVMNNTFGSGADASPNWTTAQAGGTLFGPYSYHSGTLDATTGVNVTTAVQYLQNNRVNRSWVFFINWDVHTGSNEYLYTVARENGAWAPYLNTAWGYKFTAAPTATAGTNQVTFNWIAQGGADRYYYTVRKSDGTSIASSNTTGTSLVQAGLDPLVSYRIDTEPYYDGYGGTGVWTSANVAPNKYKPSLSTAAGDTPYRRAIRITAPTALPGSFGHERWDYRVMTDTAVQADIVTNINAATYDFVNSALLPAGSYYTQVRPRWLDGRLGDWSNNSGSISVTTPTITNVQVSNNLNRSLTVTWDRLPDAATYSLTSSPSGLTATPVNPGSGTTVTYNFPTVKSGPYSITITPNYTNGYVGPVVSGSGNGISLAPIPTNPTGVGDSPAKRQIRATTPLGALPAAFNGASSFDLRLDGLDVTILNTTTVTKDFSAVKAGAHTLEARANWSDGDQSSWSAASPTINTTTPAPTGLAARQRSALNAVATTSIIAGGSIPITNTYYVAVSTNKATTRTTETVNSLTRAVNESSPSLLQAVPITLTTGNQTIRVTRPTTCQVGDTWNVYIGRDRSVLKRTHTSLTQATATQDITTAPSFTGFTEAKTGGVDVLWVAPTGVGDAPTSYRVERALAADQANPEAAPGTYNVPVVAKSGLYASNLRFWEDDVETGWSWYRVAAVWANENSGFVVIVV